MEIMALRGVYNLWSRMLLIKDSVNTLSWGQENPYPKQRLTNEVKEIKCFSHQYKFILPTFQERE